MTQEDINLLLKDICARLPYGVKVSILGGGPMELQACIYSSIVGWYFDMKNAPTDFGLDEIKPYLRPMSSMTEEEKKELKELIDKDLSEYAKFILDGHGLSHDGLYMFYPLRQLDFLNSHHFDFHDLIQKGLALEAPKDMYKTE